MGSTIPRELKLEFEVSENVPTEEEWERQERTHQRGTEVNRIAGAGVHMQKGSCRLPVGPEKHLDRRSFESGPPAHQCSKCPISQSDAPG